MPTTPTTSTATTIADTVALRSHGSPTNGGIVKTRTVPIVAEAQVTPLCSVRLRRLTGSSQSFRARTRSSICSSRRESSLVEGRLARASPKRRSSIRSRPFFVARGETQATKLKTPASTATVSPVMNPSMAIILSNSLGAATTALSTGPTAIVQEGVAARGQRRERAGHLPLGSVGDHPSFGRGACLGCAGVVGVSERDETARLVARRPACLAHAHPLGAGSPQNRASLHSGGWRAAAAPPERGRQHGGSTTYSVTRVREF